MTAKTTDVRALVQELAELDLAEGLLTARKKAIAARKTAVRKLAREALAAVEAATGVSGKAKLTLDDAPVAELVPVTVGQHAEVSDEQAWLDWVRLHRPDQIERIEQVRAAYTKAALADMGRAGRAEAADHAGVVQPVLGVQIVPAAPGTDRLTWADGGQEVLRAALAPERLAALLGLGADGGGDDGD